MKKTIIILLALLLAFACTACGNEPIDYYVDAVNKFNGTKRCQIDFVSSQTFTGSLIGSSGNYTGTIKLIHADDEVKNLELRGATSINPGLGSNIDVALESYYCGGALYQKMSGSSYYLPATWSEAHKYLGLIVGPIDGIAEQDFKALAIGEDTENTTLNFILEAEAASRVNGLINQWDRFAALNGGGSYTIDDIRGSLVLNSSRKPVSETLTITGSVQYASETVSITNEISLTFSYPDELEVATPVAAEYKLAQ